MLYVVKIDMRNFVPTIRYSVDSKEEDNREEKK